MSTIWCKSFVAFLLFAVSPGFLLASSLGTDLTVVSSSASEFHFRVSSNFSDLQRRVEADSSQTYFRTIQVGIPHGAGVSLVSANGDSLVPLPNYGREREPMTARSQPLAMVSGPITVRGRQIVSVRVFPVVGPAMYRSVSVRLVFSGGLTKGGAVADDPRFDRIFEASLANYDQVRAWPVPSRGAVGVARAAETIFGLVDTWYKIEVNQNGLYRVTGARLEQAGLDLNGVASDSIHVFNGGGLPLDVSNSAPQPEFTEVAILVEDGGDGVFNSNDYIVFYGEGAKRWLYVSGQSPRFINNPYEDRNVYWLGVSGFGTAGLRMVELDATPDGTADTIITTFPRRVHVEQDKLLRRFNDGRITDYLTWYWADQSELVFFVPTPAVVEGDTAAVWLAGRTYDDTIPADPAGYMDLEVNGTAGLAKACDRLGCSYLTTALVDGLNQIRLRLWPEVNAPPYFDYLDLRYTSRLVAGGSVLDITLASLEATAEIEVVDDFQVPVVVLDISNPLRPAALTGYERAAGLITFQAQLTADTSGRYLIGTVPGAFGPVAVAEVHPTDLRQADRQVDLIIVTPQVLSPALDDYMAYRRDQGISMAVISVEDIMDNFSYGLYDPTAIRDFLKFTYENYPAPAPSAVLLVGDGTYDYLNHLGTDQPNYVPPYIHPLDESASDDNYVYFGRYGVLDSDTSFDTSAVPPDRGYDMVVSRWPIRSAGEIMTIVDKSRRYESSANLGIWRTNITLVADDEFGAFDNETFHVTQTETLEQEHIPRLLLRNKIYLWEYPFAGSVKPGVNDAIVSAINNGTLLVNFVGHGNPDVWAHEHVFTRMGDVPRLSNIDRLPLFFNASCAIGFFDDPKREGMAEDLLIHRGGALGVVSAARLVYAAENALFNQQVFDVLLYNDSLTVAEAVYTAKLLRQYGSGSVPFPEQNDRGYLWFGDPYVRLGLPRLQVEFSDAPVSLTALGRTRISGRVIDGRNQLYARDGTLVVNVFDSERQKTYRLVNDTGGVVQKIDYSVTGPTVFRGSATIEEGFFDLEFITPLDIGYGGQGARIVAYAMFDSLDAAGLIDSLAVTDSIVVLADSVGPVISYAFPGRADFVSGDIVTRQDILEARLMDSAGINLTGGLGHGITLQLDGRSDNTINLTDRFEYDRDDFTAGKLEYPLADLQPGRHSFRIKAWDNVNNSAAVEFEAEIVSLQALAIIELLNYPNPMRDSTRFSAYISHPVERFQLEIFTLSGRRIKSFGPYRPRAGYFDDIVWYGRDERGDRVAIGVYIFKATAVPVAGGDEVESFGKVVVIN